MSDVMLFGVLRMPYELAMSTELSRRQFWDRAQEAADRISADADEIERLRTELAEAHRDALRYRRLCALIRFGDWFAGFGDGREETYIDDGTHMDRELDAQASDADATISVLAKADAGLVIGSTAAFKAVAIVDRSNATVTEKCDNSPRSNALSGTSHENGVRRPRR